MLNDIPDISIAYFKTHEAREEAFRRRVLSLIPRKYAGPRLFWKDFRQISFDESQKFLEQPVAYMTSNPRDGLVYGNARQVLAAARLCARHAAPAEPDPVVEIAENFDIREILNQPIRTLSGGETVKLALAKAFIGSGYCSSLTIASPFSWLSRDNSVLLENLCRHYAAKRIPVRLFALEGEDSMAPVDRHALGHEPNRSPLEFRLRCRGLKIILSTSLNPVYSEETAARIGDLDKGLVSPCLITGGNGQGKSLIAKALSGALPTEGSAEILCEEKDGPVRLLFQDVINQTLLRSFDRIAASSSPAGPAEAHTLYTHILERLPSGIRPGSNPPGDFDPDDQPPFRSLLEIKTMLVAARLCGRPRALILDEPDWGLNRASSISFVCAVIHTAHARGTPVILISHKPWWRPIAGSIIAVERTARSMDTKTSSSFNIALHGENELES